MSRLDYYWFPQFIPMKIEIIGKNSDRVHLFLPTQAGMKFVIENDTQGKVARLFYATNEHINMVMNRGAFLAAGYIKENGNIIAYGSTSCMDRLGKDRPEDEDVADALIAEFREAVEKMLQTKS